MDLFGRYSHGRHDDGPVVGRYAFTRHGRTLVRTIKRVCIALFGRIAGASPIRGVAPGAITIFGRQVVTTNIVGASWGPEPILGRRILNQPLTGRFEEC